MSWTRNTAAILIAVAAVIVTFALVSMDGSQAAASPEVGERAVETSAPAAYGTDNQTGIWVSGQGTLSVTPDLAIIDLGVESFAESVSEANKQAATSMDAIIAALKKQGIKEADIQTRRFDIYPQYDYVEEEKDGRYVSKRVLTGYRVNNSAAVKIRNLDAVGNIIEDAVNAAGDDVRIDNIRFTVEDTTPMMAQLREMAVKDAKAKARHLAQLSGVRMGRLIYISETSGSPSVRGFADTRAVFLESAALAAPPVSGGELDLTLSVQARFAVR